MMFVENHRGPYLHSSRGKFWTVDGGNASLKQSTVSFRTGTGMPAFHCCCYVHSQKSKPLCEHEQTTHLTCAKAFQKHIPVLESRSRVARSGGTRNEGPSTPVDRHTVSPSSRAVMFEHI